MYVSRLTVDIPSRQKPGHTHKAGTEFAPVEKLGEDVWLIEIRVPDETLEGDAWYETLEARNSETEVAEVKDKKEDWRCFNCDGPYDEDWYDEDYCCEGCMYDDLHNKGRPYYGKCQR